MGLVALRFLVGAIAGAVCWAITEPFAPRNIEDIRWERWEITAMLLLGALIGSSIGGLDGLNRGGKVHILRGLGLGLIFGAVGAALGHSIGGAILKGMFPVGVLFNAPLPMKIIARTMIFLPIGTLLGASIGASSLNTKKITQGAIGGFIGALIAGLMFDIVGTLLAPAQLAVQGRNAGEVGGTSRAITFVLLGALISLFIGLVERLLRSAWLRLELGRNEGREWSIDGGQTFIGRSESAHVPLFGDPNVAPVHAAIHKQNGQYILQDGGSPLGTFVNGQRVQSCALAPGSVIQIGGFQLQFLVKNMAAPKRGPEAYPGQSYPLGGMPQQPGYPAQSSQPYAQPTPMQGGPVQATQMQPMPQQIPQQPTIQMGSPAATPTASGFGLVAIDGPLIGQRFAVLGPLEVGREATGIPLAFDSGVSRKHARFSPDSRGVNVQDLGSRNGTFVNGQRVQQATAPAGALIKVGVTTFRVDAG